MRHIPISAAELRSRVERHAPGWLAKARARTDALCKQGFYAESGSIWSEIKPVFMALQHNKCAFCERRLEGEEIGTIEHDIEHFRPKGPVEEWPTQEVIQRRGLRYRFSTGSAFPAGYYSLAYTLLNYVTACKVCNSMLKAGHFPIAGQRCRRRSRRVTEFAGESPLLIYPLGDVDERPEQLLTFQGVLPVPVAKRGASRRRAEVTIDFFELDTREILLRERAERLAHLYRERQAEATDPTAAVARARLLDPSSPHSRCVQAFDALYDRDRAQARRMYEFAAQVL